MQPYVGFFFLLFQMLFFGCVHFPLTLICMSIDGMKKEDLNLDIFEISSAGNGMVESLFNNMLKRMRNLLQIVEL